MVMALSRTVWLPEPGSPESFILILKKTEQHFYRLFKF